MDKRPCTLKSTAVALLVCVLSLLKSIWKHLFPVLVAMLLHGCGKLGYETKYTANLSPRPISDKVALAYYESINQSVAARRATALSYATAAVELGRSISAPLAPDDAVAPRSDLTVVGTSKTFDIVRSSPPESLLPLAKERTEQVQAAAFALRRVAESSFVPVAAPSGFVLPDSAPRPLDGWDDVRQAAEVMPPE